MRIPGKWPFSDWEKILIASIYSKVFVFQKTSTGKTRKTDRYPIRYNVSFAVFSLQHCLLVSLSAIGRLIARACRLCSPSPIALALTNPRRHRYPCTLQNMPFQWTAIEYVIFPWHLILDLRPELNIKAYSTRSFDRYLFIWSIWVFLELLPRVLSFFLLNSHLFCYT